MDEAGQVRQFRLVWRGLAAILITGLVTPSLLALLVTSIFLFAEPISAQTLRTALGFGGFLALVGAVFALPLSLLGGVLVEMPKARWLSERAGGALVHWLLSVLGGFAFFALFLIFTWDYSAPETIQPRNSDAWGAAAAGFALALLAGSVSAVSWWWLVIEPWRLDRQAG
ncbi:MAG: hypothetical protein WBA51_18980 [Erythrobacter sp.]